MFAFRIGAAMLVIGGVLVLVLLERVSSEARNPLAETAVQPSIAAPSEAHATTIRELHHRSSNGIDVRLLWNAKTNRVLVEVEDERSGARHTFEVDGAEALAAFQHPYAYAGDPRPAGARAQTGQPEGGRA